MPAAPAHRRHPVQLVILLALWAAFILWNGWFAVDSGIALTIANRFSVTSQTIIFAINFWGLFGSIAFGLNAFNPFKWKNGKRLIFGSIAFAMMLGRPFTGALVYFATYLPTSSLLNQLIFCVAPIVLILVGVIVIVSIFSTMLGIYGVFIAIPVMLFNQIFAFEKAVAVYRHQEGGLTGYIVRAVYLAA